MFIEKKVKLKNGMEVYAMADIDIGSNEPGGYATIENLKVYDLNSPDEGEITADLTTIREIEITESLLESAKND